MYKEEEVDYVIKMVKEKEGEFLKAEMMTPIFRKSAYTVEQLMTQLQIEDKIPTVVDTQIMSA